MMRRAITILLGVSAVAACGTRRPAVPAATPLSRLAAEIDSALAGPAFGNAQWGIVIQSADDGELLYRRNPYKLFMPASNMKLITAAVALAELGPDHRIPTDLRACGTVDGGTLRGDLLVVGGGDPSISARFDEDDATALFGEWADSLRAAGIRRIDGGVVANDDRFEDVHIGPGWAWDYLDASYAAEIGALLFNEGVVTLRVTPGLAPGDAAGISLDPATSYMQIESDVVTVPDTTGVRLLATREPFANVAHLTGRISIAADTVVRHVAVHDPTLYFATVLTETLRRVGIDVAGEPADQDLRPNFQCDSAAVRFRHLSPPLEEMIRPFLKVSQNQMGEMFMRYLGAAATDTGSVATGRRVIEAQLTDWGISPHGYVVYDGSGLSRYNYLSPEAIVRLLRVMAQQPAFEALYDALPIAGVDGTLERRLRGTRAEGNARAKTGFISNARALSGYVTTLDGERIAFSMIANDFDVPVSVVEYAQDLIVERLANYTER